MAYHKRDRTPTLYISHLLLLLLFFPYSILAFGIVGFTLFGTIFGSFDDILGDIKGNVTWAMSLLVLAYIQWIISNLSTRGGLKTIQEHIWSIDPTSGMFIVADVVGSVTVSFIWLLLMSTKKSKGIREKVFRASIGWSIMWGTVCSIVIGIWALTYYTGNRNPASIFIGGVIAFCTATFTFSGLLAYISYILGYRRLLLYPISSASSFKAYFKSRKKPAEVFTCLHHSSLYWDECLSFPLPRLKQTLLQGAEQDEDSRRAMEVITFIINERPQQISAAKAVSQEIAMRDMERRKSLQDIAQAYKRLASLLPQEAALDEFEKLEEAGKAVYLSLDLLLDWFRSVIQNHPRLALLFSGVQTFSEMGSSWVNRFVNVQTIRVSFLHPTEARQLITQPNDPDFASEHPFSEDVVEEIIHLTACHPFLLQAMCSALIDSLNAEGHTQATLVDVAVAENQVLDNWHDYFLDLWIRANDDQQRCLMAIRDLNICSSLDIQEYSSLDDRTVQHTLQKLLRRDLVLLESDKYRIAIPIFRKWIGQNS